jgi:O-antigen ligase
MNFLTKENPDRWHQLAWWLCVVTLPWIDRVNNFCIIFLLLIWIAEGNFTEKWQKLKASTWSWPFLIYYVILLAGMIYTSDLDNGLFTLDKKMSFLVLPLVMSTTRRPLDERFVELLKRSFIYSCCIVVSLSLILGIYFFLKGDPISNFDFNTYENFKSIHPDASQIWMHFSYIQLAQWVGLHPAYLSMYLVFCLVLLFTTTYSDATQRNIHFFIGILMACAIALLSSRMAIIAFIGSSIYLTIRKILREETKKTLVILLMSVFLIFFVWLNPVTRFRVIEEPKMTNYQADRTVTDWNSVSFRLLEWEGSWSVIRSNWLMGVGTGGWKIALDKFYANYNRSTIGLEHNSHNQYLQTWMENGLLGLFAFLTCLYAGFFRLYKDPDYVCFTLIFSLMCLTESIGERQKGIVFFTLFQVLYLGYEKRK